MSAMFSRLKPYFAGSEPMATQQDVEQNGPRNDLLDDDNKHVVNNTEENLKDADLERTPSKDVQHGIQAAEAVTLTWTKSQLIVTYIL